MKKLTYIIMALALVLGLAQCKKEKLEPQNEGIRITLSVEDNGDKHEVIPGTGEVNYQTGDVIYVGNAGKYVGTLTRNGSGYFEGTISPEPVDASELHFYFVGGLAPSATPIAGTTENFTVNISDQSSKLPVLSYNHTTYHSGTSSYACQLKNKCGLVKLTLTNPYGIVKLGNRYATATIDFATPGITRSGSADGQVTFYSASSTAKWAILLPQEADATANNVTVGASSYTVSVPAIENNGYVTGIDPISNAVASHNINLASLTSDYEAIDGDILTGTLGANVKISIAPGATVTLNNATINGTNSSSYKWAGLNCNGDATIILKDGRTNTVKGFHEDYPGIHVPSGSTLIIKGETSGTGELYASSNDDTNNSGAGIGGGWNLACGNIEIRSGVIHATGSTCAAGIGSNNQACGNITISGGTVTATGGGNAAGIGSGFGGGCGDITIASTVTRVTATKGDGADHSIGKGRTGSCGTVTIGGVVTGPISDSPYTYPAP